MNITIVLLLTVLQTTEYLVLAKRDYTVVCQGIEGHASPKYFSSAEFTMRKVNRTHAAPSIKAVVINPILSPRLVVSAEKWSSNQYISIPLSIKDNFCDFFDKNLLIVPAIKAAGNINKCPLEGEIYATDIWITAEHLPAVMIFGVYRINIQLLVKNEEIALIQFKLKMTKH